MRLLCPAAVAKVDGIELLVLGAKLLGDSKISGPCFSLSSISWYLRLVEMASTIKTPLLLFIEESWI